VSITNLSVRNFQSLKHVDLELGTFTVIVGPSSSGKSALIRAFKALASNVRGTSMITRGQKAMAITGRTETHVVTLERTDRSGGYRLADGTTSLAFTKLGGDVPEHVTQALRIEPVGEGGSVNFASQFDKPYLLDESGAVVARVLGELTNVTAIFEAVRAANRIRNNASSTLKTRKNDLEEVKARLGAFQGLSARVSALEAADKLDDRRRELIDRLGRLSTAVRVLHVTERAIEKTRVPDVPDAGPLDAALNRYLDLQAGLRGYLKKLDRLEETKSDVLGAANDVVHFGEALADQLTEAGVCPTCGQQVH